MKKVLFKADCHLDAKNELNPAYQLVKKFAQDWKPDIVVDMGDFFEFEYLGSFAKNKLKSIEGKRFNKDFDLGNYELDFWQGVTPEYIQIEGNHDERLVRLIETDPTFDGLINFDLKLHLKARGIPFYPMDGKPLMIGKLVVLHGYWATKYPARRHLEKYKHSGLCGHVHRFDTASEAMPVFEEEIQWWSIGCLCSKAPDWRKGAPTGWQNGAAVAYLDEITGRFNLYPINITKYIDFIFEGTRWKL